MESMETDDDMIVVIVGDGENESNEEFPVQMKQEQLDGDAVEKLIESAATHGEMLDVFVKEELKENESVLDWDGDCDEDYVPEGDEDEEEEDFDDEGSANETHNRHRHKMQSAAQQKSFVKELREQYPELENDTEALVITLSEIMKNVKPPAPPQDYFIMYGIMFECVFCGNLSETQPAASRHYQEKHGERYLICFACGVDFRSTTNLYKHEKRCTARDVEVVLRARARTLGRKGRSRPYLPKHFPHDVKKGEARKHACSQCRASFVSRTNLRSHELLHRGLRPYTCAACPAAYTSFAALSRHRKKHGNEQFVCDHCGRIFKVKAALVTHMDTHLPVKKFGCDRCEKRYATKAALQRHVQRQHLRLPPPWVCKICHKRYPLISVLKEHTKKAHGLLLMTRRMFFTSLPTLSQTQIEQAKIVLKSELENDYTLQPLENPTVPKSDNKPNQMPDKTPVELPVNIDNQLEEYIDQMEIKEEVSEENDSTEQGIVLSKEVLQYMQSLQAQFDDGENCNVIVIQNGEILQMNYTEVPQELLSEGQLVLHNGEYVVQGET